MLRAILRSLVRFLFEVLTRVKTEGLENVPIHGGCILAANHVSRLDPALIYVLLRRADVTSLVADKYKKMPFFRWLVEAVGGIWVNREEADFHALREARDFLKNGGILGIAPEGTRSHTGALMPAKTGVAYLADKADVPIIPTAISGTDKAFHELFRLRRAYIMVRFGEPFTLPHLERGDRTLALHQNTEEIMCRIAALLPPAYRGVYADHARLLEFLVD